MDTQDSFSGFAQNDSDTSVATSPEVAKNSVELVPQDKSNACWLASTTMMRSWKNSMSYPLSATLEFLDAGGGNFTQTYNNDQGLSFDDNQKIVRALGLTALPPASYTIDYFFSLLKVSPIMAVIMFSENSNIAHMVVITGISGDKTADGSEMDINDPLPVNAGHTYTISFTDFLNKFEAVVAFENNLGVPNLTSQLFYFDNSVNVLTGNSSQSSGNVSDSKNSNTDSTSQNTSGTTDTSDTRSTSDTSGTSSTTSDKSASGETRDSEGFRLLDSGSWNNSSTTNFQGGQIMHFEIKNVNVLGTTITIGSNLGGSKSLVILPLQTGNMRFDCFGSEPMGWSFDVSTNSDAFIVAWKLYSSWLPGDAPNG